MAQTPWLSLLEPLRDHLEGRDHRGRRGSLRWLEAVIAEEGGRSGTVRNILYKDLGSFEEKKRLFDILAGLYEELGLETPDLPDEMKAATAKRLLGRDKRLIFARFTRALHKGDRPQLVVVGGPATGKSVLLEQIREALADTLFINLSHDLVAALYSLAETLGVRDGLERLMAGLSPVEAYALQAQKQRDILTLLSHALNEQTKPLLIRAERKATLGGIPLRNSRGEEVAVSAWLEPMLKDLKLPYLLTCSSAPPTLTYKTLRPPSRREARTYLRQRLPEASSDTIEGILNKSGRSYGEMSRLVLLELSRTKDATPERLHRDPRLGPFLQILAALSPEAAPEIPNELLEAVLERSLSDLSQAEKALIEPGQNETVRPALRSLLPKDASGREVHEAALAYFEQYDEPFKLLYHAKAAGATSHLTELLERAPSNLALLPGLWQEAERWESSDKDRLAMAVIRYRAVLGDYAHPESKAALEHLTTSRDAELSAWAKIKMSEALIDEGRYQEAEALSRDLPEFEGNARAEQLLVEAALARWQGRYAVAEGAVKAALELPIPPVLAARAKLWQGLVAKDAGRFDEALKSLCEVEHLPLLMGRARYQEGDLLTRQGQPEKGAARIREALQFLRTSGSDEERARVRARLGTALRHLGLYREAAIHFRRALSEAPDGFTRARIASEASIFQAAQGRPWAALKFAGEAEAYFRTTEERPNEAAYRHRRTLYRLAVAYWVWDSGEPYRAPFRGGRASAQAIKMLEQLLSDVTIGAPKADRYASLYLDIHIALSLMLSANEAFSLLANLKELPNSYLQQQAGLACIETHLRVDDPKGAAALFVSLRKLPGDPGLLAWKLLLEAETALMLGQEDVAVDLMTEAEGLPAPYRAHLGRRLGQVLEARGFERLANHWLDDTGPFALPEALALAFSAEEARLET